MNKHNPFKRLFISLSIIFLYLLSHQISAEEHQYRLDTGDKIKITVFGQTDLSGEFEIDNAGRIPMPLIKEIEASGKTVTELEVEITDRLKPDYLRDPKVSIEVLNYRPFYILGEVKSPGGYPYVNGMSVITAVALAGGYTYRAKTEEVMINREIGKHQKKIPANRSTRILPGDIIEVPEKYVIF